MGGAVIVLGVLVGIAFAALWWVVDDAMAARRARQRVTRDRAISLARIELLQGGARQALVEEALIHRLSQLDFNRLSDRL
jgi:hypothetical protein